MPPKVHCHRCWKTFTSKGRLLVHKAFVCPAPIASFKGRQRPPKPRLVFKPEPDGDGDEQEATFPKPEQKPSKREEPLRQDPETGHWTCVRCERSYEDQWSAIKHVTSSKCKNPKPPKTKTEIKLDPERSQLVNQIPDSGLWTCNICKNDRTFSTRRAVLLHANTCSGETRFKCEGCSFSFNVKENLAVHLKSPTRCQYIRKRDLKRARKDARDIRIEELNSAKVRHIADSEQWQCELCEKTFTRQYTAVKHAVGCNGTRNFSCDRCNFSTPHNFKLARHLQSKMCEKNSEPAKVVQVEDSDKWRCTNCSKTFPSRRSSGIHASSCNGDSNSTFVCDACGLTTKNKSTIFHHLESTTSCQRRLKSALKLARKGAQKKKVDYSGRLILKNGKWKCVKCRTTFLRRRIAIHHTVYTRCSDIMRFTCSRCNYKTNVPLYYRNHRKEGNIMCRAAQRRIQKKEKLAKALVSVSRPSKAVLHCPSCAFSTVKRNALRHHLRAAKCRAKSGETISKASPASQYFQCPNCPYKAKGRNILSAHQASDKSCQILLKRQELMRELGLSSWPERITEFRCPRCPYVNKSTSQMLSHLQSRIACALMVQTERISALNGARQCENCDKLFASTPALLKHLDSKICRVRGLKMIEM